MPEEIKLRMARAYPDQVQRVREWFQQLDELFEGGDASEDELGLWLVGHYGDVAHDWERILFGYDTLIENVCDQTKSYLEFKPEIKAAIAAYDGVGELVRAVGEFLKGRERLREMRMPLVASPVIDEMERAWKKLTAGDASKPPDVGA